MKWLYDSSTEAASTFRICSSCGSVYRINSGDGPYEHCPNCGEREEEEK